MVLPHTTRRSGMPIVDPTQLLAARTAPRPAPRRPPWRRGGRERRSTHENIPKESVCHLLCEGVVEQVGLLGPDGVGLLDGGQRVDPTEAELGLASDGRDGLHRAVTARVTEAVDAETAFAADMLAEGVPGLSVADTRRYLEYVADQRLVRLGLPKRFGATNPFGFLELQDVSELANFFERTVSAYQVGVDGSVAFDEEF